VCFSGFGSWLWSLPPAEAFEFAVEWPFGGIDLTIVELDGAAIVVVARRWAPTGQRPRTNPDLWPQHCGSLSIESRNQ
jgi:hypothetical protein